MSQEKNTATYKALSEQIQTLMQTCETACKADNNMEIKIPSTSAEAAKKSLDYLEGLRTNIENSETSIANELISTSQFITETKEKVLQVQELKEYTKGVSTDLDNEIKRLGKQVQSLKERGEQLNSSKRKIQIENVQKAKERFEMMKTELLRVMRALFPNFAGEMKDLISELMQAKLGESGGFDYVDVPNTKVNNNLVMTLINLKIVTRNPYNPTEVKLAYKPL